MLPVTNAFYLASLLLLVGLVGLLLRRPLLITLLFLEVMLTAAQLALVASSRLWASVDGHALALLAMTIMAVQGAIAAALVLLWLRGRAPGEEPPLL